MRQPHYQALGFTLIEATIVITTIAILAISAFVGVDPLKQFMRGYDTVRKNDLDKLQTAFEDYYLDHDCYPTQNTLTQCGSAALAPYLSQVPCDPNTGKPYTMYFGDESVTCPQNYIVYSSLANKFDPNGDQIAYCPDTIAIHSSSAKTADLIKGCSGKVFSVTYYGCITGSCQVVAQENDPPPSYCPKVYPDNPTCNNQCTKKDRNGKLKDQCAIP